MQIPSRYRIDIENYLSLRYTVSTFTYEAYELPLKKQE